MIISHLWLERRSSNADPEEQFAILATNLEDAKLRYRFRFVVSQEANDADCTDILRGKIQMMVALGLLAPAVTIGGWSRHGRLYRRDLEIELPPGETLRVGLQTRDSAQGAGSGSKTVFQPDDFLRGHWELSLPELPRPGALPKPQLDRPARILITVLHRRMDRSGPNAGAPHETWVVPLASGKAEHLIPPDRSIVLAATDPGISAGGIHVSSRAASRKRARRRTR